MTIRDSLRATAQTAAGLATELRAVDPERHDLLPRTEAASPLERGHAGDAVRVQFLGVSTLSVADGQTQWLTDGYFSRPHLLNLRFGRLRVNRQRVRSALARAHIATLDAVVVAHSHVDHALDSAHVAQLTGARLHGSTDTRWIAQHQGFDLGRYHLLHDRQPFRVGRFTITPIETPHSPGDLVPGRITGALPARPRMTDLRTGACYTFRVQHPGGDLLIVPSANHGPLPLSDHSADTVYLGIGGLGNQPGSFIDDYWAHTVLAAGASRVIPIHWDNFTRSLDRPLRGLPRTFDDLGRTLRWLRDRSERDGVDLVLPALGSAHDPFG